MFSLGTSEILVILVVALVVFGKRLPEVSRSLGRTIAEFRRGLQGLQNEFEQEMSKDERAARASAPPARNPEPPAVAAFPRAGSPPATAPGNAPAAPAHPVPPPAASDSIAPTGTENSPS